MKNVIKKWWFWLIVIFVLIVLAIIIYCIMSNINNTQTTSTSYTKQDLSNTNQSVSERKKYIETHNNNGVYSFSLSDDNGNGYTFNAYGVIQFDGENCKIKYSKNKTSTSMETNTLSGTCGLKEGNGSSFYFSIYAGSQNKEVCTYKCVEPEIDSTYKLISEYNFAGCSSNKELKLNLLDGYQDIYSAFTDIEKQENEKKEAQEKARKEQEEKDFKANCKTYTYEEMARNPEKFKGTKVKLTGEVVQALYGSSSVDLRVNITKQGNYSTYYTDTVYIIYYPNNDEDRILEDDIITIYGTSQGDYSYTSTIGATVTLPLISANYVDIKK